MSTATGIPAAAETGRHGPAGWPRWAVILLAVLAWIAALAAYILVWVAVVVTACIPGMGFGSGE